MVSILNHPGASCTSSLWSTLQRQLNDHLCCESHCLLPEEAPSASGEAIQAAAGTMALGVTDTVSRGSIPNLSGSYHLSPFCRRNCFERVKALTQGHRTRIQLKPVFLTPSRAWVLDPCSSLLGSTAKPCLGSGFCEAPARLPMGWTHSFLRLVLAVNGSLLLLSLGIVPRKAPKEVACLPIYKTNISGVKSTCTGRRQRQTCRLEVSGVWEGLKTVLNQPIVMETLIGETPE